jgi:hypothetical protein
MHASMHKLCTNAFHAFADMSACTQVQTSIHMVLACMRMEVDVHDAFMHAYVDACGHALQTKWPHVHLCGHINTHWMHRLLHAHACTVLLDM